ncbi:transcription regulatory SNF2 domain protein, partial [Staphylococcus aureus]
MKAKDYLDMPDRVDTKQTVVLSEKERKYMRIRKNYILESEEEGTVVAQNGASLSQK